VIAIVSNNKLGLLFTFGQDNNEIIDELTELFIQRYGAETYGEAQVILVTSEKFFHVIKNAYHLPGPYKLMSQLGEYISRYIDL
tara:strand:- start:2201 stop:2452 length:252 start_codon:yes stop_codon:yes gene_type:complete